MKQLDNLYLGYTAVSSKAIRDILALNKKIRIDTGKYILPALPSDTVVHRTKK
jgi:hypothetical protein